MKKYLVFDIGGSNVKYGLLSETGDILKKDQVKTPSTWDKMTEEFHKIITKYYDDISGIAVSAPGRIDVSSGIIYEGGAVTYLDKINIKKYFKDTYNLESSVINDGKAAGQAELWKGNLKGVKEAVSMTLGTGIGGAVIIDGKIHDGRNFAAGEFSSILPSLDSFAGSLAQRNSAVLLVEKLADIIGLEDKSDGISVFEVVNSKENKEVNRIFEEYCKGLAIFIANLQTILDISHVVIGGGISNQEIVIQEIRNQYSLLRQGHAVLSGLFEPLTIEECRFSSDSNLLGALYQLLLEVNEA